MWWFELGGDGGERRKKAIGTTIIVHCAREDIRCPYELTKIGFYLPQELVSNDSLCLVQFLRFCSCMDSFSRNITLICLRPTTTNIESSIREFL
jgi:hypothetical protein